MSEATPAPRVPRAHCWHPQRHRMMKGHRFQHEFSKGNQLKIKESAKTVQSLVKKKSLGNMLLRKDHLTFLMCCILGQPTQSIEVGIRGMGTIKIYQTADKLSGTGAATREGSMAGWAGDVHLCPEHCGAPFSLVFPEEKGLSLSSSSLHCAHGA